MTIHLQHSLYTLFANISFRIFVSLSTMSLTEMYSFLSITNIVCLSVVGFLLYRWLNRRNSKLPPGPIALPLLGSLPFMEMRAERTFNKWAKKYGPILYVKLGSHWTVVLNSYEAIDEAFNKQGFRFNGRYRTYFSDYTTKGLGIMFLNGAEIWKTQRRFGSRALSGVGLGGKNIEERILEEVGVLLEVIRSKNEKPFVFEFDLIASVANVISGITVKEKCDEEGNERLRSYVEHVIDGFRIDGLVYSLLSVLPLCRFLPFIQTRVKNLNSLIDQGNNFFDEFIEKHMRDFDPSHIRDFTDLFLAEKERKSPTFQDLKQLRYYLKDLFAAGTETSSSTIRWILLYLIKYPDIQERIHEEIDEVLGREGRVKLDVDLPYTKAVIQEGFRIKTVTPLGVPRRTTEDVFLMGYHIPKNTQVLPNIWAVHNDPVTWPEPDRFDPERHLDKSGKFVKSKKMIPFSMGSRNCLGENLARSEIFLFLVSILQKFEVKPNPDNPIPDMEGIPGVVNSPRHCHLIMHER